MQSLELYRSSQRRRKFDPKAQECVLVGYPDGIKGYKLWNLKEKRFLISRDVTFQEDVFPFNQGADEIDRYLGNNINYPDEELNNDLPYCTNQPAEKDECDAEETVPEEIDIESCSTRPSEHLAKETPPARPKQEDRDPVTVKEALSSPEANLWRKTINEEITNLTQAQTWELITKPPGMRIIPSRWLFRKKKDEAGKRANFKARLVAKDYVQVPGVDFKDTFSPVIKLKSIRLLLATAAEKDFEIHQMDITAAYLNGVLEEDLYMAQPEGFIEKGKEHFVCHLKKAFTALGSPDEFITVA
ncbi:Retrovirus-related Pol polyprotein from transposon TNT 1-94 [Araneus ventricosus]|uniref:Retrovirus-related Pol polyprotein from transposon TNT 1-94 n=1 Tax=Araneus ventricosus TaxID=182803 RepID=A0A4Y2A3F8_ARAVE|nr:Retrovirus-related Pol polyprotein from transposon TNT 1-94 [Araneus ventricosus]